MAYDWESAEHIDWQRTRMEQFELVKKSLINEQNCIFWMGDRCQKVWTVLAIKQNMTIVRYVIICPK